MFVRNGDGFRSDGFRFACFRDFQVIEERVGILCRVAVPRTDQDMVPAGPGGCFECEFKFLPCRRDGERPGMGGPLRIDFEYAEINAVVSF